MANSQIRWKQGDYMSLGKAVKQFNNKINALKSEENKLYLPEEISYQEAKENITTRQELNRVIKSLRRFQREGAEELYKTQSGEQMTRWERRELGIQSRIAQSRLRGELKELSKPSYSGYSKVQMGSLRAKEIERNIEALKQIENKVGYEFERLKKQLQRLGKSDYEMKKAITYRENYIKEMEKYSHFDNYELLVKKMNELKNPLRFFEFMKKDELAVDLTYQSDQYYGQQEFNSYLERLGIKIAEDSETVPQYIMELEYSSNKLIEDSETLEKLRK